MRPGGVFSTLVVSDIAIFVLKRDVKLQLTNFLYFGVGVLIFSLPCHGFLDDRKAINSVT